MESACKQESKTDDNENMRTQRINSFCVAINDKLCLSLALARLAVRITKFLKQRNTLFMCVRHGASGGNQSIYSH